MFFNHNEDIYEVYKAMEKDTIYTPADVADITHFNVRQSAIFLRKLVNEGSVTKIKIMPHFKTIFEYGYIKKG